MPFFYLCICLSVIMLIIDLLQNRLVAGVTRCHLFMVHYLCRICKCGLHAVLWSHIGTFMCRFAAVPQNFFFSSHSLCGAIFVTVYLVAWDWWVLRAGPMLFFIMPSRAPFFCLLLFSIYLFSMGWHCMAGVFALIVLSRVKWSSVFISIFSA